jgi:hypothetical protein
VCYQHPPGLLALRGGGRPAGATGWWLAAS